MRKTSKLMMAISATSSIFAVSTVSHAQQYGISQHYLTGVWKEDQRCRKNEALVFFPNGSMQSAGSPAVNYTVTSPTTVTAHGPGGAITYGVQYMGPDQIIMTVNRNASVLYRCSGSAGPQYQGGYNAPPPPPMPYQGNQGYAPPPGAPGAPGQMNNFVGGWTSNNNCASNVEIYDPNGQFTSPSTGVTGQWSVFGNTLRVHGANNNVVDFTYSFASPRNVTLTQNSNGQVTYYTRCY